MERFILYTNQQLMSWIFYTKYHGEKRANEDKTKSALKECRMITSML